MTTMKEITIQSKNNKKATMKKQGASLAMIISLAASALAVASISIGRVEAFSIGTTSTRTNGLSTTLESGYGKRIDVTASRKRNLVTLSNQNRDNTEMDQEIDSTSTSGDNIDRQTNNPVQTLLVAAAVTAATLDPSSANADATTTTELDLVSPGMAVIETKIADSNKLFQSTETTLNELVDTMVLNSKNRNQLGDSLKRIQADIKGEISSVEAWKEVTKILQDYGIDLQKETSIVVRPPADLKRAIEDVATKRINVLVNGEIVQIDLEYNKGTNTKQNVEDGKPIQPDDEWVLRIKGYKGFDPNALPKPQSKSNSLLFGYERKPPPLWLRQWDNYWNAPLADSNPFHNLAKTHGDAIVIGGTTAIALSYAVSYAYYLDQIEQEELAAQKKKEEIAAKKKKAAAAAKKKKEDQEAKKEEAPKKKGFFGRTKKETPPSTTETEAVETESKEEEPKIVVEEKSEPEQEEESPTEAVSTEPETPEAAVADDVPEKEEPVVEETPAVPEPPVPTATTTEETAVENSADENEEEEEDDIQVSIDFDEDGKVIITAINGKSVTDTAPKRGGPIAFAQALWLPWMGFFVSSKLDSDDRSKPIKFAQSLLFPWAGILFRKQQSVTEIAIEDEATKDKKK